MALNEQVTNVAEALARSINAGQPAARANLGGGGVAWGWTGGMLPTVADFATPAFADGMTFPVVRVTESGTPATIVAPGAPKPQAASVASGTESLSKFAAYGTANLEDLLNAANLGAAIASVLGRSSLKAFEVDAIGKLDAGAAAVPVTGTSWVDAAAAAQARLLGAGGTPSVLVVSALDYGAFITDVLGTGAFAVSPESPVGGVLGTAIHVSAGAAAGKAFMFDAAAVVCAQHESSPLIVADAMSEAKSNKLTIVTDLIAGTFVVDSALVIEITAPTP